MGVLRGTDNFPNGARHASESSDGDPSEAAQMGVRDSDGLRVSSWDIGDLPSNSGLQLPSDTFDGGEGCIQNIGGKIGEAIGLRVDRSNQGGNADIELFEFLRCEHTVRQRLGGCFFETRNSR